MNKGQFLALQTFGLEKIATESDSLRKALMYSAIGAPVGGALGATTGLARNYLEGKRDDERILHHALIGAGIGTASGGLAGGLLGNKKVQEAVQKMKGETNLHDVKSLSEDLAGYSVPSITDQILGAG